MTDCANAASDVPIKINQDANIFVSEMDPSATVSFDVREGRQAYVLCMEGSGATRAEAASEGAICIEETTLSRHEAAEVQGPCSLTFTAAPESAAHFLIVEMAFVRGSGRSDL